MAVTFTIIPKKHQLIVPAEATPIEIKTLSDIDDQDGTREGVTVIMFYRNSPSASADGLDPVEVIREAVAKTLVYYYPYAGRLIEGPHDKLMVDCTAEGVLFLEADAAVSLDQLGDTVQPPSQYPQLLLFDFPGFDGMLASPLMLLQVTRFKCGGFVLAIRFNHMMSDIIGSLQFVTTMSELAKGASTPSTLPVWERELLTGRNPATITHSHPEYEPPPRNDVVPSSLNDKNIMKRSFSFGPQEMKAIRKNLSPSNTSSAFEIIAACLWRSRTRALRFDPDDDVGIMCAVNVRGKHLLDLPKGYYGNAIICPAKVAKVKTLCGSPLEYAIKLVREARRKIATPEYVRSTLDFIATRRSSTRIGPWNFIVADAPKIGFDKVDFGWGNAVYGGTMDGGMLNKTICGRYTNKQGEDVIVTTLTLPAAVMDKFDYELKRLIYVPSKL